VAASAVSMWTQRLEGALEGVYVRSGPERLVTAGKVVWFYLGKLIWPYPLVFVYPRWEVEATRAVSYLPLGAVGVATLVLWLGRKGWGRSGLLTWVYYLVALLPVLGLVDHYFLRYSFVGDHFQYLASMGPLALAGAGLSVGLDLVGAGNRLVKVFVCGSLLVVLGGLTWGRTFVFRDNETLWRDTLTKNPACWMAHNNFGNTFKARGQTDEAIRQYQEALRLKPNYADAHNNLGAALGQKGRTDEAIRQFHEAVRLKPNHADAHNNLGVALGQKGQTDEAIRQFREAIRLKPDHADAHNNLGVALNAKGQNDEAVSQFQEAIRLQPSCVSAHFNLGVALGASGRTDEAIDQYQDTIRLRPDHPLAHNNLGEALRRKGQSAEAIHEFQEALRLKPDFVAARQNLQAMLAIKAYPAPLPGSYTNR
jgi:tetratricopeptide (TPR) repeat protein